jgi:GNAT superfamily N-acetyltransferase
MPIPTDYRISLNPEELQLEVIHGFLVRSYWAEGIPFEVMTRSLRHSTCVGAYHASGLQVGFARLVTDHATFGYLADVFVLEEHRGKGLSVAMTRALLDLPEVRGFRRIILATRDAHGVYERCGFERVVDPSPYMVIRRPDIYRKN